MAVLPPAQKDPHPENDVRDAATFPNGVPGQLTVGRRITVP
jgi:hypothetical protein